MRAFKVVLGEEVVAIGNDADQVKREAVRAFTNDPSLLERVLKVEETAGPVVVIR